MGKARLQLGIEFDMTGDGKSEVRLTPIDKEMPPDIAAHARELVKWLDSQDPQPGDGEADVPIKARIPVKLWFIRTDVTLNGSLFLKVRE